MTLVASRELRNDTAGLLRRAQAGEDITITVAGRPAARLTPLPAHREWIPRSELARRLRANQADPGLRDDLAQIAGDTTDDLPPLR